MNTTYRNLLNFLMPCREGDTVSRDDLMAAMEWKETTLNTYVRKRKLDRVLKKVDRNTFTVLRDGDKLTVDEIRRYFTQANPRTFTPARGMEVQGESSQHIFGRKLGRGAIGEVWSAESRFMGNTEQSALKYLAPREDLLKETMLADIKERFRRESRIGMKLKHDYVIRYQDFGEHEGVPFLTMELADGSVLQELEEKGGLSIERSVEIVRSCLQGIDYLHAKAIVHRDVKPANILFTERGPVLGDLGVVRWSDFDPAITGGGSITKASMQIGSWYYMAPEQRENPKHVTTKSDIYALGITWYELLSHKVPDPSAVGARRYSAPCTHPGVNDIIGAMISFDAEERPSVDEIEQLLESL